MNFCRYCSNGAAFIPWCCPKRNITFLSRTWSGSVSKGLPFAAQSRKNWEEAGLPGLNMVWAFGWEIMTYCVTRPDILKGKGAGMLLFESADWHCLPNLPGVEAANFAFPGNREIGNLPGVPGGKAPLTRKAPVIFQEVWLACINSKASRRRVDRGFCFYSRLFKKIDISEWRDWWFCCFLDYRQWISPLVSCIELIWYKTREAYRTSITLKGVQA